MAGGISAGEPDIGFGWWPQWRGPNRDGLSRETGLIDDWKNGPPKLLWMASGLGSGWTNVSIVGDRIYTTGDLPDGQAVIALRAADGTIAWSRAVTKGVPNHEYPGARSTPSFDEGRLYVVTSDEKQGGIVCLQATDGAVLWQKGFLTEWGGRMMSQWGFAESPLVDGDWVLCTPGARDAVIVALDKTTGQEVWRTALEDKDLDDGAGYSSIVVSHGAGVKQYVQLVGRGVIGVRASDGKLLWTYTPVANKTANVPTCIVKDDYVFCSTGYNQGSALLKLTAAGEGVNAEEVYFLNGRTLQNQHGGIVLVDDHLYLGHGNDRGYPTCVELLTGKIAWGGRTRGPGRGEASLIYADGKLLFRFSDGKVAAIEATPKSYNLLGVFEPEYQEGKSWAHPVIAGGRLYLREQDKLMCYDLRKSTQ
ncbi:MAG: polyvinylalcohol dehydrogenase [Planctomycetes bacterium]|nr:polyvinylalcohol dehydrogenase [Planctomycetota bacterium]